MHRGGAGINNAAFVEQLQAQLKLKEGELVQLQLELGNLERAKDNLSNEVTRLTQKVESLQSTEEGLIECRKDFAAMEHKYQTMLTVR